MARKPLLTEAEIRSFMKLANLTPVGDARLQEWSPPLEEEEVSLDEEDDDKEMDELPAPEDDMEVDVKMDDEPAPAPEMDMDMDMDKGGDMGDEDLMGEEDLMEALRGITYVPSQTEIVNEVAQRVARRLKQAKLHEAKLNRALGKRR